MTQSSNFSIKKTIEKKVKPISGGVAI